MKNYIKQYIGQKFNRLTILENVSVIKGVRRVKAVCDCGKEGEYVFALIKRGNTKSCGCFHSDIMKTHGLTKHPLYDVWVNMIQRCYNDKNPQYINYGGRGVSVSSRWVNDFKAFYDWAIDKWRIGLQLDKDIRSGYLVGTLYAPEMCCFATPKSNTRRRRNSLTVTYNNETLTLAEWSEKIGIPYYVLKSRKQELGWPDERIISEPFKKRMASC